jgi:hypothetical protein
MVKECALLLRGGRGWINGDIREPWICGSGGYGIIMDNGGNVGIFINEFVSVILRDFLVTSRIIETYSATI